jgi:hypothetical protein
MAASHEIGDKDVDRVVVDFRRRAELLHAPRPSSRRSGGQRHRLDLVVGPIAIVVPMRWCNFLISVRMSTRSLASSLTAARQREDLRIAHERPPHGDALALAAESCSACASEMRHLQRLGDRATARLAFRLGNAAHLQPKTMFFSTVMLG